MLADYKYMLFFSGVAIFVPFFLSLVRRSERFKKALMFAVIFLFFASSVLDINFMSMETYRGTVRGFEITFIDLIVLVLCFAILADRTIKKKMVIPGFWLNLFYLSCMVLSLFAETGGRTQVLYGLFGIFQYLRFLLFYWTFYHLIESESDYRLMIWALSLGVAACAGIALTQRYVLHMHRIAGTMWHPNLLSAYSAMAGAFLGYLFLTNVFRKRATEYVVLAGMLSAFVTTILTVSRGGIVSLAIGLSAAVIIELFIKSRIPKKNIMGMMFLGCLALLIWFQSRDTIMDRITNIPESSDQLRIDMKDASVRLAGESIFGCGYNNFSSSAYKYLTNPPPTHNVYYLTFAELGYIGLFAFLLLWARFIVMGARQRFVADKPVVSVCVTGMTLACLVLLLNSWLEDHPRRTVIMYLTAIYWAYIAKGALILRENTNEKTDR